MKSDNVISLGVASNDPKRLSVKEMLQRETDRCTAGETDNFNKALLIYLDDNDREHYDVSWANAGMQFTEIIALLEVTKQNIINESSEG